MGDVIETTARDVDDDGGFDEVAPAAPASTELERREPSAGDVAVAQAADAAMSMPGVAGRDEFLMLAAQARMLSLSGAAPKIIRESVYVAFHVAMIGRDLGLSPSAALELIDVISTSQGPRISLSPQLLNGQVRRLGLGEVVKGECTELSCTAIVVGPGGRDRRCRLNWPTHVDDCTCDIIGSTSFTWEDARIAGLVAEGCQPGAHTPKCQNRNTHASLRCNQGYVTYPKRMLWWRASGFAVDDFLPEAGMGLYSPEELGAVVDADGRPIDPATVELPAGYEPAAVGSGSSAAEDPADPDDLWALQLRVWALPEAQREAWQVKKREQERLRGVPTSALPRAAVRLAKSLLSGLESQARKDDPTWDAGAAALNVERRVWASLVAVLCAPPAPDDGHPAPQEPAPAPETPSGAQGGDPVVNELVADLEQSVAEAKAAAAARAELEPAAPTGAQVDEIRTSIENMVKGLPAAEVRELLAGDGLEITGGVAACRKRLVGHMLAAELNLKEQSK